MTATPVAIGKWRRGQAIALVTNITPTVLLTVCPECDDPQAYAARYRNTGCPRCGGWGALRP